MRTVTNRTNLGRLILRSGLPQYKVAAYCDIAYSTFQKYVTAKEPIRPHHLRAICGYFHVDPEDVVGIAEDNDGSTAHPV